MLSKSQAKMSTSYKIPFAKNYRLCEGSTVTESGEVIIARWGWVPGTCRHSQGAEKHFWGIIDTLILIVVLESSCVPVSKIIRLRTLKL